jgi:ribonuclease P protein component
MKLLEFIWLDNLTGHPRMGLIVPKFQSTAVARNRLRRRLSEIWRRDVQGRQAGCDLLVRARLPAYRASFTELRGEMVAWVAALWGR